MGNYINFAIKTQVSVHKEMGGFFMESESSSEVDGTDIFRTNPEIKIIQATLISIVYPSAIWECFTTSYVRIIGIRYTLTYSNVLNCFCLIHIFAILLLIQGLATWIRNKAYGNKICC